ncbi:MAG: phospholipase D-like domain-containing protein, partial [Candidatus Margulisiibacteriota bacterium]
LGGVEVVILVPGKADRRIQLSFLATAAYLEDALLAGIKVYQYDPERFIHAKVITVDGIFASIGSANVDQRSMNINFEMNALIYDRKIVKDINEAFFRDLENSSQLTREMVSAKSSGTLIAESLVRLLSPIL